MSRLALISSVGYFFYKMARQYIRRIKPEKRLYLGAGTDMVKCARCYTYVPQDTSLSIRVNGKEMTFCSSECIEAYRRDWQDIESSALGDGNR